MKYTVTKARREEKRKQLRVWLDCNKYERLRQKTSAEGVSIYRLVNDFVDGYLASSKNSTQVSSHEVPSRR